MPDDAEVGSTPTASLTPKPECFVVMPISDPEGYESGHFQRVFEDIFVPACDAAGYRGVRADQIRETNLIHLDVLQRLLESAMVLVDLSSRNPNVLFELGLRQAFDRPVVLVQEVGTPKIFDIAPLRFTEYRRTRIYHEVLEDQRKIADAICATRDAFPKGTGVNSIVRILSLTKPAALPEVQETQRDPAFQIIRAEISELRDELRRSVVAPQRERDVAFEELERLYLHLDRWERHLAAARETRDLDTNVLAALSTDRERLHELMMRSRRRKSPLWHDLMMRMKRLEREFAILSNQPSAEPENAG